MQGIFNIPERWSDPVAGLKRIATITLAVLLVESLPLLLKERKMPISPIALLGLVRLADILILILCGPLWFKGPELAKRLRDAALITLLFTGAGFLFLTAWRSYWGSSMLGGGGGAAYLRASSLASFLVTATLLSPLAEELYFRGLLYRKMREKRTIWVSMGAVSLLFASVHLCFGGEALFPLLGSIIFCVGYEATKTILTPILLHISGNLVIYMSPFIRFI
jgi:membrane protease YdiL (CAAX protease family)